MVKSFKIITTHTPRKNPNKGKVTAAPVDEIAVKQRGATEAYSKYAALRCERASKDEAVDPQDRRRGEQLLKIILLPLLAFYLVSADAGDRASWGGSKAFIGSRKNLFKVDKIVVEGLKKVEPEAILEKIAVRRGMVVDNYLIRGDIKRIYEMKHFETVEVHRERRKKKNVLIFRLREKPTISQVTIVGNVEVDKEEILEQLKTKKFSLLDINTLKNDVTSLQKFYEEKGFFLATVNFEVKKSSKQRAEVIFSIKEFDKVKGQKDYFFGQ